MKKFKYVCLCLKNAYALYIKRLLIIVALFVVVFLVALGILTGAEKYGEQRNALMKVSVVSGDSQIGTDYLISMVSGIQGVSSICEIEASDLGSAMDGLEKGIVDVVIKIPTDFYANAMNMEETSIEIITWGEPTKLQKMLLAQLGGAQDLMSVTEGAIYSCYDGMKVAKVPYTKGQMENDIFMSAISNFMIRDRIFSINDVSAYGNYDFVQFISVSVLISLMLLSGVLLFGLYGAGERQLERIIFAGRFGLVQDSISKIFVLGITIATIQTIVYVLLNLIVSKIGLDVFTISGKAIGCLWIVSLSISVWVHFIVALCGSSTHSRALFIMLALLMLAASGVVVPSIYLPGMLRKLSTYIPTGTWHTMMLDAIYGRKRINAINTVLVTDVIIGIMSVWLYVRSLINHD